MNVRKGKVAEQHPEHVDNGQREDLLRDLGIKLEQAAACNAARAMRQPSSD